jgi:hypothetical protein
VHAQLQRTGRQGINRHLVSADAQPGSEAADDACHSIAFVWHATTLWL